MPYFYQKGMKREKFRLHALNFFVSSPCKPGTDEIASVWAVSRGKVLPTIPVLLRSPGCGCAAAAGDHATRIPDQAWGDAAAGVREGIEPLGLPTINLPFLRPDCRRAACTHKADRREENPAGPRAGLPSQQTQTHLAERFLYGFLNSMAF